jgi:hypothetical protein
MTARLLAPTLAALALCLAPARAADPPPAAEKLKGFEAKRGLFTLHVKENDCYLEVPAGLLGAPFLLATSVSGGSELAGQQWADMPCAWVRLEDRLMLVEREVRYRVKDPRKPIAEVVRRTYSDRVIQSVPIVAMAGANPVVDVKALFGGRAEAFFGKLAARLDAQLAEVTKAKTFPENVVIALSMPDASREGRITTITYALSSLPRPEQDRFQTRVADDRVGYFLTAAKDWTDDTQGGDRFVRWINRWELQKADPTLERSPVKEPIIFYIEKTVPFRFRQAVADGILEWNKAFEEIGLLSAVVVRQQTDTEFADLDPEDVRYNFFRWIVSERAFAMGPSRVNPWTGQILDADIIFDESMVRSYLRDYEVTIREAPRTLYSPAMNQMLDSDPERFWFARREPGETSPLERPGHEDEGTSCSLGDGLAQEIGMGLIAADLARQGAPGAPYPDAFMSQLVKDVVMHEVGHTLGLRHNFAASTWRSMSEINSEQAPLDICGSVMDYNPVNVRAPGSPQGGFAMRGLGPYDLWAIKYGYATFPDEAAGLAATVAAVSSPQYAYATDEDTTGPDPRATRWDLGRDPLEFAQQRMELSRSLWTQVVDRVVPNGDGYRDARRAFDMMLGSYQGAAGIAARYVGGEYVYRDHKGDAGARDPIVPIPAEIQRRALDLVCRRVLEEGAFASITPELLRKLGKGNWSHWGSNDRNVPASYPIHTRVLGIQSWALWSLTNPDTLSRLIDAEAKAGPQDELLTVPDVLDAITKAVFGKLVAEPASVKGGTARAPIVPTIQRNLQREWASELIAMVTEAEGGPTPPIVRALAMGEVRRIADAMSAVDLTQLDPYSRAHVQETQGRLKKALDAGFQLGR